MKIRVPDGTKTPWVTCTLVEGRWKCDDPGFQRLVNLVAAPSQVTGYNPSMDEAQAALVIERWPGTVIVSRRPPAPYRRDVEY
jgi:hypothetical protein